MKTITYLKTSEIESQYGLTRDELRCARDRDELHPIRHSKKDRSNWMYPEDEIKKLADKKKQKKTGLSEKPKPKTKDEVTEKLDLILLRIDEVLKTLRCENAG